MYDLIVIGGGPAGLAAGVYASRQGIHVLVLFEDLYGKARANLVSEAPDREAALPGNAHVKLLGEEATNANLEAISDSVVRVTRRSFTYEVETREHGTIQVAAVVVATGAAPMPLAVPGAAEAVTHGLAYSATTYASQVAGKRAAVIGGGMRALAGAAELALTATRVTVIAPHTLAASTGLAGVLRRHPRVELLEGYEVLEARRQGSTVELVVDNSTAPHVVRVEYAFVSLGLKPNSEIVRDLVETDRRGFIAVDDRNATSAPGLFAAGDVTTRFGEQVLVALGDGARAGASAYQYLLARWLVSGHRGVVRQ